MTVPEDTNSSPTSAWLTTARYRWCLAAILLGFVAVRLPIIYLSPGGIDEEWYSIPGLTILQDGLPRLPMFPSRNPQSLPFYADQCVYFMPPLFFYVSAAYYALLPHLYGTARLVSLTAGIVILLVVGDLTSRWTRSRGAALWSVGLLSVSRLLFIPATIARPDILCGMFGLLAIWTTSHWVENRRWRWLTATGAMIGLGGLTHPYAIAYAVQIGLWVAWEARGWKKLWAPTYIAALSIAVLALWIPLILKYPDIFRVQFHNQLFTSADNQRLYLRLLNPWPSFVFHSKYMFDHMTTWQSLLLFLPLTACTVYGFKNRRSGLQRAAILTWSAIYLICTTTGPHHLTWNYFVYPVALGAVCLGWMISTAGPALSLSAMGLLAAICWRAAPHHPWNGTICLAAAIVIVAISFWLAKVDLDGIRQRLRFLSAITVVLWGASMVPGSYARVLVTYVRHWNDPNYNAPMFAQMLLKEIPPDAVCVVDKEVLLDFFVAGRTILSAQTDPTYFSAERYPYDYFLCGEHGVLYRLPPQMCCERVRDYGEPADQLGVFMTLYRPSPGLCVETTGPPATGNSSAGPAASN